MVGTSDAHHSGDVPDLLRLTPDQERFAARAVNGAGPVRLTITRA